MGPAYATLPGGDVGVARSLHCHGIISGAKYYRIADRHQSVAIEHEGSYFTLFELIHFLNKLIPI